MSNEPDGSWLYEAITGKQHRLEKGIETPAFMIELSDTLLINVHIAAKRLDILIKDQEVFRYIGDLSFSGLDEEGKLLFHSLGINHVHFNNRNIRIDNPECKMSTIFVKLSLDKKRETEKKLQGL